MDLKEYEYTLSNNHKVQISVLTYTLEIDESVCISTTYTEVDEQDKIVVQYTIFENEKHNICNLIKTD